MRIKQTKRRILLDYVRRKKSAPCDDCNGRFPPICMDFDHRNPKLKKANVSQLVRHTANIEIIKAEIAKCDLVCSNCHRIRTHLNRRITSDEIKKAINWMRLNIHHIKSDKPGPISLAELMALGEKSKSYRHRAYKHKRP